MGWIAKSVNHRGQRRIAVYFEKDPVLIQRIKRLKDVRWSQTLQAWHLPDTEEYRIRFKINLEGYKTSNDHSQNQLSTEVEVQIEKFNQWLRSKRYSENTIKTYHDAIRVFLRFFPDKELSSIENNDIIDFNNEYILKNKLSASYQNQVVNAVKLFFRTVQNRNVDIDKIDRPKKPKTLPNVLSKEEIKAILEAHGNIKHRAMLSLIYACGLRRSELLNLQPVHVDSRRGVLLIKQAKGRKDRITPISEKIILLLREYYKAYKPQVWLFEGQNKGERYSEKSLENVLNKPLKKQASQSL